MSRTRIAFVAALATALIAALVASLPATLPRVQAMPAAQDPAQSPLSAVVTLGRSTVTGQAGSNAEVSVEVTTAGGAVKGSAAGRSIPLVRAYSLDVADATGRRAPIAAGDRVTVRSGEATIADSAPALTVLGDTDSDVVLGTAPPGAAVTVTVRTGLGFDAASRGAVADG